MNDEYPSVDAGYFASMHFHALHDPVRTRFFIEEIYSRLSDLGQAISLSHHFSEKYFNVSALFHGQVPSAKLIESMWDDIEYGDRKIYIKCRQVICLGMTALHGDGMLPFDGAHVSNYRINVPARTVMDAFIPLEIVTTVKEIDFFFRLAVLGIVKEKESRVLHIKKICDMLPYILEATESVRKLLELKAGGEKRRGIKDENVRHKHKLVIDVDKSDELFENLWKIAEMIPGFDDYWKKNNILIHRIFREENL